MTVALFVASRQMAKTIIDVATIETRLRIVPSFGFSSSGMIRPHLILRTLGDLSRAEEFCQLWGIIGQLNPKEKMMGLHISFLVLVMVTGLLSLAVWHKAKRLSGLFPKGAVVVGRDFAWMSLTVFVIYVHDHNIWFEGNKAVVLSKSVCSW